jgi:hypothetical protein
MPGPLPRARLRTGALAAGAVGLVALATLFGCGDDSGPGATKGPTAGVADSGANAPPAEYKSAAASAAEHRPPPAFRFEDVTAASGMSSLNHSGRAGVKEYLPEAVGVGPAWLDYDHDGRMDLYVPDGDVFSNYVMSREPDPAAPGRLRSVLHPKDPKPEVFHAHLWHNLGGGKFEDVAATAGVQNDRWGFGALAWDFDGDGWTDLFVANFGRCRLYRNNGNGTFKDVAEEVGLAGDEASWSTCATCGDYDGDGRLDLYVGRYLDIGAEVNRQRELRHLPESEPVESIGGRSCKWRGLDAYCGPLGLVAQHDSLYHQEPDGTFRDVSVETKIRPKSPKYAFTCMFVDYDADGLMDVYVANDSEENFLWKQRRDAAGKPWFEDVAESRGVKYGQQQNAQASMGAATADIDQDGILDIFVTNFSHDYNNIFLGRKNPGGVSYIDRGLQVMGQSVFYDLSWGCGWYDFDDDADLDLFVANGHVYKEIDLFERTGTAYDQYPAVFECLDAPKLKYREVGPKPFKGPNARPPPGVKYDDLFAGAGLEVKRCCRGAAFCDWDDDGDVDVYVQTMNEAPIVLENRLEHTDARHWLKLSTAMPGTKNTEAIGALVRVLIDGGPKQTFPVYRCQSFLGTDDPRIPVGLGGAKQATVVVTWPGAERKETRYEGLAADAHYLLTPDGKATKQSLPR